MYVQNTVHCFQKNNRSHLKMQIRTSTCLFYLPHNASWEAAYRRRKRQDYDLRRNGTSIDDIAIAPKRSKKVVWTFIETSESYEKAKKSERPSELSGTDRRILLREAHKGEKPAGQLCQDLDLPIEKKRVQQIMRITPQHGDIELKEVQKSVVTYNLAQRTLLESRHGVFQPQQRRVAQTYFLRREKV